jgi:hypothetical protein
MDLRAGGTDTLSIVGGNVGIGTTNPQRELEIQGAGNVYARITASTDNDSAALELNNNGNAIWTLKADDTASDSFKITHDSAGTALTIDTSKNVGIGSASPTQKLDVAGAINIQDGFGLRYNNSSNISIVGSSSLGLTYTAYNQHFKTFDGSSYTEHMTIATGGNVGIGVTNPSQKLEVGTNTDVSALSLLE